MSNLKHKLHNDPVKYTVVHRPRVTKRMHLELDKNGGLVLVAPSHWSQSLIKRTVEQNRRQISRFMQRANSQHLSPLYYQQGAEHLYLGRQVSLELLEAGPQFRYIAEAGGVLNLPTTDSSPEVIKKALQLCYRHQAIQVFSERLKLIARQTSWARDVDVPLSIRRMKRTWGNCSSAGKVKLNVHLIKAPLEIIDSVIAHELCHLKEMNHSKRFYALLEGLNPHWHSHRTILRANGFRYLQE